MEQHCGHIRDLEKLQTKISGYYHGLQLIDSTQSDAASFEPASKKGQTIGETELTSVYDQLCHMQLSIAKDIADLETILNRSKKAPAKLFEQGITHAASHMLSCKENEVLNMFAMGYSYNEVAAILGCKLTTIQTHTKRIYKKLHVHSRSEAIYEARQLDILPA